MAVRPLPVESEQWQRLDDLTSTGDYHAVKQWLAAAQADAHHRGDVALENLLAVAAQLCDTCFHHQEELATYKQEYETAVKREQTMRQQLQSVLQAIGGMDTAVTPPKPPLQMSEPPPTNLWQRARGILKKPSLTQDTAPSGGQRMIQTAPHMVEMDGERPSLTIYCFGSLQVYEDDHVIDEWASRKGKAIFKYLLMHRDRPVAKEQLMDLFWPNSHPDAARNNLNVAIYGLRQALRNGYPDFSHIIFQDDCYILNPEMRLWVDVEAFEAHWRQGKIYWQQNQPEQAVYEYQAAVSLYQGEFLAEDRYEEWIFPRRHQLEEAYLEMLAVLSRYYLDNEDFTACIECSQKILRVEPCQEAAHRHLMQAYYQLGQAYLAIRQYHECVTALQTELEVSPEERTTQLYESIRQRTY
ncbi:MAG TPA: hypothetical protein ENK32_01745 [Anaerolineae bacterium]|nr:hypothetical protein [Anaerolineae bacterium]